MTGWSDVITAAMQVIDDERWRDELRINAAQFYRAKSQTVIFALPLMSKPPELLAYLQTDMMSAGYDDFVYISEQEAEAGSSVTVETGKQNYDICNVSMRSTDGMASIPVPCNYDTESGNVTLTLAASGVREYSIDFYKDGEFQTMTPTQMRLFALAVAVTWDDRFQRDWMANTMKIHDGSFETVNESNYMDKSNARFLSNKQAFEDELRDYEQKCAYATVVSGAGGRTKLI